MALRLIKDQKLTKRSLDGLFNEYYPRVYNYVYYRTMSRTVAEDVTSDVMYRVARSYASFDPSKGTLDSWTFRIARNLLFSHFRSTKDNVPLESVAEGAFAEENDQDDLFNENEALANRVLAVLSDEEREMVFMKYWQELPNKIIAERLSMNASTVSTKLSRALAKIRKEFPNIEL